MLQLRDLLKELPPFVREFMNGVADNTTARTRMGYAYDIGVFLKFLTSEVRGFETAVADIKLCELETVNLNDIEEFKSYLDYYIKSDDTGKSERTVTNAAIGKSRKLSAIRSMYRYFQKKGAVEKNPTDLAVFPKISEKPIIRLEYNEVARLLDVVESGEGLTAHQRAYHEYTRMRDFAIITLMLGTGARVSECAGVDINHVDFENGCVAITRKGGNQAVVYIGDEVEEALGRYMDVRDELPAAPGHENALFLSLQKKRLGVRAIQNIVKKYAKIVTGYKNITPHKLRSTFGTNLYQATNDIYLVADVLGHKSVETTRKHYAEMSDARRRAARSVRLRKEE